MDQCFSSMDSLAFFPSDAIYNTVIISNPTQDRIYDTLDTLSVVARAAYKPWLVLTGHECLESEGSHLIGFLRCGLRIPHRFLFRRACVFSRQSICVAWPTYL